MMQILKRVIGLVLDTIKGAMLAPQTPICQIGGNSNTVEPPLQPVAQESKPKRKRVQAATTAQSRKPGTSRAQTRTNQSQETGTQPATPVRQAAPQNTKRKRSAAPQTIVAPLRKVVKKAAPATNGVRGKQPATPVAKIRPPAKPKSKQGK